MPAWGEAEKNEEARNAESLTGQGGGIWDIN